MEGKRGELELTWNTQDSSTWNILEARTKKIVLPVATTDERAQHIRRVRHTIYSHPPTPNGMLLLPDICFCC